MTEEQLIGGFVNSVVRVGSTVRRSTGPWTPAVHALLRHLESVGFAESPRVLGVDADGREALDFLEGEVVGWTNWPSVMLESEGVGQLGALLRRYHQAVRGFEPGEEAIWRNPLAPATGELIRHGDFSPFNSVWRGGRVVGIIDWDFAMPGSALSDLAYLAWYAVPLADDGRATEFGSANGVDRAERLRVLCAGYGGAEPARVVEEALRVIEVERTNTAELVSRGLHPWTKFAAHGALEGLAAEAAWIRANRLFPTLRAVSLQ